MPMHLNIDQCHARSYNSKPNQANPTLNISLKLLSIQVLMQFFFQEEAKRTTFQSFSYFNNTVGGVLINSLHVYDTT